MIPILTNNPSVNTNPDARTVEFVTPTALCCHCEEYRTNHFCSHLVFYIVAKIQAFSDLRSDEQSPQNAKPKRKGVMRLT